jgi:hypothetical protein
MQDGGDRILVKAAINDRRGKGKNNATLYTLVRKGKIAKTKRHLPDLYWRMIKQC